VRTDQKLDSQLKLNEGLWDSTRYLNSMRKLAISSFSGGERDHLFLNLKAKEFRDIGAVSGLDAPGDGRTFVHWDYDRDGWQDFAVASSNYPLLNLYHNQLGEDRPDPNLIAVRFVGGNVHATPSKEFSNRDGIGASVAVELGERTLVREYHCGEGLAAQNSSTMLVGLGDRDVADTLTVQWPAGKTSTVSNIPAGTKVTVYENPAMSPDGNGYEFEPYLVGSANEQAASLPPSTPAPEQLLSIASASEPGTGKLRVYTTMASWCTSCKKWLPQLSELRESLAQEDLAMYGVPIDVQDTSQVLANYAEQFKPAYELLAQLPPDVRTSFRDFVSEQLHTDALPATVVTTPDGRVVSMQTGIPSVSDIKRLLEANSP